jgi:hypothetical protein
VERWATNTLRSLGIVVTLILVGGGCCFLLLVAWLVVIRGGLTPSARILRPQAADAFFGSILAAIALVTAGVVMIVKLAKGIARSPARSEIIAAARPATVPAVAAPRPPSPAPRSRHLPLWPVAHNAIDRLVLALAGQIAISAITLFQIATRAAVPHNWILMLLPPFLLSEVPDAILIYVLLKQPGRRAFTFLIAMLVVPILKPLFNPMLFNSYRQIYMNHSMGLVWIVLSGLIYLATLVLAYVALRQSGLWPKFSSTILATTATFFYFFLIKAITPYLYSLWT